MDGAYWASDHSSGSTYYIMDGAYWATAEQR